MNIRILKPMIFAALGLAVTTTSVLIGCGANKSDGTSIRSTGKASADQAKAKAAQAKAFFESQDFKVIEIALPAMNEVYVDSLRLFWKDASDKTILKKLSDRLALHKSKELLKALCADDKSITAQSEIVPKVLTTSVEGDAPSITGYVLKSSSTCESEMQDIVSFDFIREKGVTSTIKMTLNRKASVKSFGRLAALNESKAECVIQVIDQKMVAASCTGLGGDIEKTTAIQPEVATHFELTKLDFQATAELTRKISIVTRRADQKEVCETEKGGFCVERICKGMAEKAVCTQAPVEAAAAEKAAPATGDGSTAKPPTKTEGQNSTPGAPVPVAPAPAPTEGMNT